MFYDVILVYSVCSIVLRIRNKGDDDDDDKINFILFYLKCLAAGNVSTRRHWS